MYLLVQEAFMYPFSFSVSHGPALDLKPLYPTYASTYAFFFFFNETCHEISPSMERVVPIALIPRALSQYIHLLTGMWLAVGLGAQLKRN